MRTSFAKTEALILVHVTLEGTESIIIKMALDTGSRYTVIPYNVAEKIGCLPKKPKKRINIMTGSGCEKVVSVVVPLLSTLGKKIENLEVLVHNLPEGSYVTGLLGLDFLRQFNLKINFKKGHIDLTR